MLLGLMRKHAKSWLIKFMIAIIVIVFVFYFGYSFREQGGGKIAYVNDELITYDEYQKAYRIRLDALKRQYRSMWSDNLLKMFDLENAVLEELIETRLITQEAERIGLGVTEEEIRQEIFTFPAFQYNGMFNEARYRTLLSNNQMTPEDFEESLRRDMLLSKITQFLMTFSPVTEQEIRDQYTFTNEQLKISYVQFSPKDFQKSVQVDDVAMAAYFQENRETYRVPEKIKVAHITIDPAAYRQAVQISDQVITYYYEDNLDMFKEEKEVKARHILFNVAPDAPDEEVEKVRERALAVLEKARNNEDFAALAKKYSEGPTAPKGGDLGFFTRGRMAPAFEEAAFSMEKGAVSDLVRTEFGFHIIKVDDIKEERIKPLAEVKEEIKEILIDNESMDIAHEKTLTLIDQMPYDVDLTQYAEQNDVPVKTTDFFPQDEPIPGIGGDSKLRESLFAMNKESVSDMVEVNNKYYIFQVMDKKESYLPEMEEVKDRVKNDYINHLASVAAKTAAEKYLKQLLDGKDWDQLAKEKKYKTQTTDYFTRQGLPSQIGYVPEMLETAFKLGGEKRYPDDVFENSKGAFVMRWEGYQGIDEERYTAEKEIFRNSIIQTKTQEIYRDWVDRLKDNADIDRSPFKKYT
ncbi:MAG: SurA N-terminal domain-containing protein [Deltaproteobacteria bacterium]|nr:SurA N-terminal domain-containing protein [Deltaproteobacteria bacterium]